MPAELPELPQLEAALQAEQHALLKTQVRRIEHQLRDRVLPTPDAQRLVWIPGIGALVAYTLLLEIDDITRFPSVRQFHSYCRLVRQKGKAIARALIAKELGSIVYQSQPPSPSWRDPTNHGGT